MRRESGFVFSVSRTWEIWSMRRPSPAFHERHCTPYTGPSSPSWSAHSFQMRMPCSWSQDTFEEPERNHRSSPTTDLRCTRFVVISGKPLDRS